MDRIITICSKEGDVILDTFCGSGSTCVSASRLNRDYIGIERDTEYHSIAVGRIEALKKEKENQLNLF